MEAKKFEGRESSWKEKFNNNKAAADHDEAEDDSEEEETGGGELMRFEESEKQKKAAVSAGRRGSAGGGGGGGGGGVSPPCCQAERCGADLIDAKRYHRRHKVCEFHSKAAVVIVSGLRQRFCQQCSRFHELTEFDESKRSCRRRLAGHNERRRKSSTEPYGEGSSRRGVGPQYRESQTRLQADDQTQRVRYQITPPSGSSTSKHFQIR